MGFFKDWAKNRKQARKERLAARQKRLETRLNARSERVKARKSVKLAKVEAKAASGFWSPEGVEARQKGLASALNTVGGVAGAVGGVLGGKAGSILGALGEGLGGDDGGGAELPASAPVAEEEEGIPTMYLVGGGVGLLVLVVVAFLAMRK